MEEKWKEGKKLCDKLWEIRYVFIKHTHACTIALGAHTHMVHACANTCGAHSHAYMHAPMHVASRHACVKDIGAYAH